MILHGFTHAYGSMLVPLYFRMVEDLKLAAWGGDADRDTLWRDL